MQFIGSMILSWIFAAVPVSVSPLDGTPLAGEFVSGTRETLQFKVDGESRSMPTKDILEVKVTGPAEPASEKLVTEIGLTDGSHLAFSALQSSREAVTLENPAFGSLTFPLKSVASLRFAPLSVKFTETWNSLRERDLRQDLLVLEKDDILDFHEGVISSIDDQSIVFLLDGEDVTLPRNKVFGVIYYRKTTTPPAKFCDVRLQNGDQIAVKDLIADAEMVNVILSSGAQANLPWTAVQSLDYSLGKVLYLSAIEPRDVKYTPFFDIIWEYTRDRNLDGQKLQLGNTVYERGLCLHSRTAIRYRIGRDYRRFRAVMGIDRGVSPLGHVHVTIRGDEKILLETVVRGDDPPRPLDIDVTGVRDLEIVVDFGEDLDIADHLTLADALIIK
ncbi:MAG: NPCBM/NEW2 domain-containing protein [Planctomycetota bacterium]|nr:NPCBM/NEW2 domain-containing protein [Planctomycetota bacterium]MDA1214002.1 NPCBM/NEW2 domain-containing protein [Planctomycetota bacterium]